MKHYLGDVTAFTKVAIAALFVVLVAISVGISAYIFLPPNSGNAEITLSPTLEPGRTSIVENATSLKFRVLVTNNGDTVGSYVYYGKNLGTDNFIQRVEVDSWAQKGVIDIINNATETAWQYENGKWSDISQNARNTGMFGIWEMNWNGYFDRLLAWTGSGDYTYSTQPNSSIKIYEIQVNPALEDVLFTHT